MKQDKWEERLERHLADYEKSPSHDLWEGIESGLQKEMKRQARMVTLRRWMIAAALVGVVSGGTVLFWRHQQPTDLPHSSGQTKVAVKVPTETENTETMLMTESDSKGLDHNPQTKEKEQQLAEGNSLKLPGSDPLVAGEVKQKSEDVSLEKNETAQEVVKPRQYAENQSINSIEEKAVQRHHNHQLRVNLYASSGMSSLKKRNGVLMSPTMLQNFAASRTREGDSHVYLVGYEERESHDQPISFGLTVSYPLTNRLSIGTGVVYTKLNSNFMTVMQDYQIHRHQTLHYVGIPLNLQYTLWKWYGLDAYLSAGGQADWNVKAKVNTDGVDIVMSKDRMQWSIGGSLGVQYSILPQLGIYAEPGIRYYFDNGSDVSNFFKDKPTDFHLELGLRFRWQ
jgi:hypothetical protein